MTIIALTTIILVFISFLYTEFYTNINFITFIANKLSIMDVQKNVKHLCLFLLFYSFTITSRIVHQGTVGWRDIIATAGYSLAMVIVFWYFLGKRESAPKKL